jgi:predicted phosphodiesterase
VGLPQTQPGNCAAFAAAAGSLAGMTRRFWQRAPRSILPADRDNRYDPRHNEFYPGPGRDAGAARRPVGRPIALTPPSRSSGVKLAVALMKLAVFTDVHANLPALRAALGDVERDGYDLLIHLGDAIGIGPFPAECLDLLLENGKARFVIGNHDEYFAHGLPQPKCMSGGEVEHQLWTHRQIDPRLRSVVAGWPYHIYDDFGVPTTFVHYPLDASGRKFAPILRSPAPAELDRSFAVFAPNASPLNFYGHDHNFSDLAGRARYVNPGSLGCAPEPIARYTMVEYDRGDYRLMHRAVPYDDVELLNAFESRKVPDREFIYRAFFGGRFPRTQE